MGKQQPSMSKSALLLSPCLAWAHPKARWYDEKYTDTTDRDLGTEFHRLIDGYLKGNQCAPLLDETTTTKEPDLVEGKPVPPYELEPSAASVAQQRLLGGSLPQHSWPEAVTEHD